MKSQKSSKQMISKVLTESTNSDDSSSMIEQAISSPEPDIEIDPNTLDKPQKLNKEKQMRKYKRDEEANEEKEEEDKKKDKGEETYIKKDEGVEDKEENEEGKEKQKKQDRTEEDQNRKEEGKEENDKKRKKEVEEDKEKHMKHDVGEEGHDRKGGEEEASKKPDDEKQSEKERLMALSSELKENWRDIKQYLEENGVKFFYHFTDIRNIKSIKDNGGLFSWKYCEEHGIKIPSQGGNELSKQLDKKYNLEDYVHLSFCSDHPMMYRLKQQLAETGVKPQIGLLKFSIDVACIKSTLFSDMNAADKNHHHGGTIEDLKMVKIPATKMLYLKNDNENFHYHQAEVMVKTFIPKKFIKGKALVK